MSQLSGSANFKRQSHKMGVKEDSNDEDMDRDSDSEKMSGSDNDSLSDRSDSDESLSDMDEDELERRRADCIDQMSDLERQFALIREQLYRERFTQVDSKLLDIRSGRAQEYLMPLQQLQDNMRVRTEVAALVKQFAIASIQLQIESEQMAAQQNLQSELKLLMDSMEEELDSQIRSLEEDRNNIDVNSALWVAEPPKKVHSRRKPITVSGPYVVYMLSDEDILQDLTVIKKALTACKRKSSVH